MLDAAVDRDEARLIRTRDLPGAALRQPVVRLLPLVAVVDFLLEQPVLVVDAVAAAGHSEGRQRIQEAGGQPAQTAVAEGGVGLAVLQLLQIRSQIADSFAAGVANLQVVEIAPQRLSDQKLDGKVVKALRVLAPVALLGLQHAVDQRSRTASATALNCSRGDRSRQVFPSEYRAWRSMESCSSRAAAVIEASWVPSSAGAVGR